LGLVGQGRGSESTEVLVLYSTNGEGSGMQAEDQNF